MFWSTALDSGNSMNPFARSFVKPDTLLKRNMPNFRTKVGANADGYMLISKPMGFIGWNTAQVGNDYSAQWVNWVGDVERCDVKWMTINDYVRLGFGMVNGIFEDSEAWLSFLSDVGIMRTNGRKVTVTKWANVMLLSEHVDEIRDLEEWSNMPKSIILITTTKKQEEFLSQRCEQIMNQQAAWNYLREMDLGVHGKCIVCGATVQGLLENIDINLYMEELTLEVNTVQMMNPYYVYPLGHIWLYLYNKIPGNTAKADYITSLCDGLSDYVGRYHITLESSYRGRKRNPKHEANYRLEMEKLAERENEGCRMNEYYYCVETDRIRKYNMDEGKAVILGDDIVVEKRDLREETVIEMSDMTCYGEMPTDTLTIKVKSVIDRIHRVECLCQPDCVLKCSCIMIDNLLLLPSHCSGKDLGVWGIAYGPKRIDDMNLLGKVVLHSGENLHIYETAACDLGATEMRLLNVIRDNPEYMFCNLEEGFYCGKIDGGTRRQKLTIGDALKDGNFYEHPKPTYCGESGGAFIDKDNQIVGMMLCSSAGVMFTEQTIKEIRSIHAQSHCKPTPERDIWAATTFPQVSGNKNLLYGLFDLLLVPRSVIVEKDENLSPIGHLPYHYARVKLEKIIGAGDLNLGRAYGYSVRKSIAYDFAYRMLLEEILNTQWCKHKLTKVTKVYKMVIEVKTNAEWTHAIVTDTEGYRAEVDVLKDLEARVDNICERMVRLEPQWELLENLIKHLHKRN